MNQKPWRTRRRRQHELAANHVVERASGSCCASEAKPPAHRARVGVADPEGAAVGDGRERAAEERGRHRSPPTLHSAARFHRHASRAALSAVRAVAPPPASSPPALRATTSPAQLLRPKPCTCSRRASSRRSSAACSTASTHKRQKPQKTIPSPPSSGTPPTSRRSARGRRGCGAAAPTPRRRSPTCSTRCARASPAAASRPPSSPYATAAPRRRRRRRSRIGNLGGLRSPLSQLAAALSGASASAAASPRNAGGHAVQRRRRRGVAPTRAPKTNWTLDPLLVRSAGGRQARGTRRSGGSSREVRAERSWTRGLAGCSPHGPDQRRLGRRRALTRRVRRRRVGASVAAFAGNGPRNAFDRRRASLAAVATPGVAPDRQRRRRRRECGRGRRVADGRRGLHGRRRRRARRRPSAALRTSPAAPPAVASSPAGGPMASRGSCRSSAVPCRSARARRPTTSDDVFEPRPRIARGGHQTGAGGGGEVRRRIGLAAPW